MIELRYVLRRFVIQQPLIDSGFTEVSEQRPILQYRKFALGTDASGALTPAGSPGWSDWQDVPTVKEE